MSIESLIRSHVALGKRTNKGFESLKCQCCNDYKYRGGFKFEDGVIFYNCFNCGKNPVHNEAETQMSGKFREVLRCYGITDDDIDEELNKVFFERGGKFTDGQPKPKKDSAPDPYRLVEIEPPPGSYRVVQAAPDDPWGEVAREYLKLRHLNPDDPKFMLSTAPEYRDRLIIPTYRYGKLVYWQARAFDDGDRFRYINCEIPKENVIYGYENLQSHTKKPLFVTEGFFDAELVQGASILGSSISEYQRHELRNVRNRPVVFVIDKDRNGKKLGRRVLAEGWQITFISGEIDDISESFGKMGKLWTVSNLMENIKEGLEAQLWLEMLPGEDDDKKNKKGSVDAKDDPYGVLSLAEWLRQ